MGDTCSAQMGDECSSHLCCCSSTNQGMPNTCATDRPLQGHHLPSQRECNNLADMSHAAIGAYSERSSVHHSSPKLSQRPELSAEQFLQQVDVSLRGVQRLLAMEALAQQKTGAFRELNTIK
eukprot:gnl/MRDRNA2_/MRDRNA2_133838_c0_seq1.p1 gnl/MRDRNA2_/MRDRNA2_133838_c0~~gnl/MRDRNA2_/MRDRNA2_133838_c0_seq1.p1  ORF type:complete len:122 (-),score=8.73 gnl/MRDRNA2_/MRDRNA2_133838_c0_seq1:45-410(-)